MSKRTPPRNSGGIPEVSTRFSLSMEMRRLTNFSGANGDREIFVFPFQLTTSRISNLTWSIITLAISDDHTNIHTLLLRS